jgi:hypothetical protein
MKTCLLAAGSAALDDDDGLGAAHYHSRPCLILDVADPAYVSIRQHSSAFVSIYIDTYLEPLGPISQP